MNPNQQSLHDSAAYERRLKLLLDRLPDRLRRTFNWLRNPTAKWLRIPVGLLLMVGGLLSILPIFGLWMLPLGAVLLSEDIPLIRRQMARLLAWIERRHPNWMGLQTPSHGPAQ